MTYLSSLAALAHSVCSLQTPQFRPIFLVGLKTDLRIPTAPTVPTDNNNPPVPLTLIPRAEVERTARSIGAVAYSEISVKKDLGVHNLISVIVREVDLDQLFSHQIPQLQEPQPVHLPPSLH